MTNTNSKSGRGGARAGAGRPQSARKRRNIAITDEMYALAARIGARTNARGAVTLDASDGIERALKYYEQHALNSQ